MNDQRVYEIFAAALEKAPSERETFLEQACQGQTKLRAEVDELLRQDSRAERDGFLGPIDEPAAAAPSPSSSPDLLVGQRIGPYEVTQFLASGGMGSVYLAVRVDDYRQQVAIKLLNYGWGLEERMRRFHEEREILATLSHPNIARLLDGGTTKEGQPYLVMEHVEGVPIDIYCHQDDLTPSLRLELLRSVCSAVHHAHQRLVLHRDLKPSNILVDKSGQPKVLDFSVARTLGPRSPDGRRHTTVGQHPGTLNYMSPEQILGDPNLDVRSDVYALGVIGYELLTKASPYDLNDKSRDEIQHIVCHQTPLRPSAQEKALRGDIDTILTKALEKNKTHRYASAGDLAADIERHLTNRTILARRTSMWERVVKWCRRNPPAAIASGIAGAVAIALMVVSVFLALRQHELLQQERQRLQEVAQMRDFYSWAVEVLNENRDSGLREEVIRRFSDAQAVGERLTSDDPDDPGLLSEQILLFVNLGNLYQLQHKLVEAENAYQAAQARLDQLPRSARHQRRQSAIFTGRGDICRRQGDLREAIDWFQKAVDIRSQLAVDAPQDTDLKEELGTAFFNLGRTQDILGMTLAKREVTLKAQRSYMQAIELLEEVCGVDGTPKSRAYLGRAYSELGALYGSLANGASADEQARYVRLAHQALEPSLEMQAELLDQFPTHADFALYLADTERNVGRIAFFFDQRPLEALKWLNRSLDHLRTVFQLWPDHMDAQNSRQKAREQWQIYSKGALQPYLKARDYRGANELIERVGQIEAVDGETLHELARLCCLACDKVQADLDLDQDERSQLCDQFSKQAWDFLEQGHKDSLFDEFEVIESLETETSFWSLRERADFRACLDQLTTGMKETASSD